MVQGWQKRKAVGRYYLDQLGRHLFVERVRINNVVTDVKPDLVLHTGNEVVLSGRREFVIGEENWIGDEVNDIELLGFSGRDVTRTSDP